MSRHNGSGGHTDSVKLGLVRVFNFFSFSMNDDEAFRGADDAPVMAVADFIHGLKHQLAQLTKMVQTGVKLETVGIEERQSVKDALSGLDGGDVFNEAVAALYQQAEVLMVEGTCFTCHKQRIACKPHVNEACSTKRASRTTVAIAGSAPRINATQEMDRQVDRASSGSEELWTVSQRMTGSAFADGCSVHVCFR